MKVEYLELNTVWLSDKHELSVQQHEDFNGVCEAISRGDVTHLVITCFGSKVYFNKYILKGCVISLIKEGEE